MGSLPVRQTLWTVIGQSSQVTSEPEGVPAVSAWKQELLRLKSAAAAFESACATQGDDPEETVRCYQLWNQRLRAARTAFERELTAAGAGPETASGQREADAIENHRLELVKRVEAAGRLARPAASPMLQKPGEIFRRALDAGQPVVRGACEGRADSLMLDSRPAAESPDLFYRRMAAAVLALLACLAVAGVIPGTWTDTLRHWPHAIGVVLGLAWWLWLSPSVLGLGIALVSVLAAGRGRMTAKK